MSVKPTSVPTKRLAQSILSTDMTFRVDNIIGWDGNALVAGDFGTQGYAVFRDAARTRIELFEFDPTTIASSEITINKRGLKFTGDRTTQETDNKFDWTAGDTYVDLGTDTPQLIQYFQDYIDALAIAGSPAANETTQGLVEEATLAETAAMTATGGTGAKLFVTPEKLDAIRVDKQKFTSTAPWTKPAGARMVEVFLIGGGGGGGSGSNDTSSVFGSGGSGGGGGGYSRVMFDATTLGDTETVTVGTGGQGGQTVATAGAAGLNTSFGTVIRALANGGGGGAAGQANGGVPAAAAGGTGITEDGGAGGTPRAVGVATKFGAGAGGGGAGDDVGGVSGGAGGAKTFQTLAGGTASGDSANAGNGNTLDADEPIGGTGGGGSGRTAAGTGTYKGGNGGLYGGGGGGGGSYRGTTWAKGGDGADGIAVVITYF